MRAVGVIILTKAFLLATTACIGAAYIKFGCEWQSFAFYRRYLLPALLRVSFLLCLSVALRHSVLSGDTS